MANIETKICKNRLCRRTIDAECEGYCHICYGFILEKRKLAVLEQIANALYGISENPKEVRSVRYIKEEPEVTKIQDVDDTEEEFVPSIDVDGEVKGIEEEKTESFNIAELAKKLSKVEE